jgi:Sortase domain
MAGVRSATAGHRPAGGRYPLPVVIALTALLAASLVRQGAEAGGGPPQPKPAAGGRTTGGAATALPPAHAPLTRATPSRVLIPALRVDAPLTGVGLAADDGLAAPPPADRNLAGWFTGGPTPGEQGTAVVDGHVDNARGPAVFYGLGALRRGNTVDVLRADHRTAVFTVYDVEVLAKRAFPADRVYDDTGLPELRVITCGGGFTKAAGYDSDVVVFARLTDVR